MADSSGINKQENASIAKSQQIHMPQISKVQKRQVSKPERLPPSAAGYLSSPKHSFDLKEKIEAFQKSLQVGNKQIYQKGSPTPSRKFNNEDQNQEQAYHFRRVVKKFNDGGRGDKQEGNFLSNSSSTKIFQKIQTSDLDGFIDINKKVSRVDSLPSIRSRDNSNLKSGKESNQTNSARKNRYGSLSAIQQNSSLDPEEAANKALEIFRKGQEKAKYQQSIDDELQRQKEEAENASIGNSAQSDQKKIKKAIKAKDKLQKLEKIKARIEEIKQLENLLQTTEGLSQESTKAIQSKVKKLQDELGIGENTPSEMASHISEDSFIQKLDEISINEDVLDQHELDRLISAKMSQSNNGQTNTQGSKAGSKSSVLESIMEEHSEYFDHLAGKCHCGEIACAKCRVTNAVNQKRPVFLNMQWQSSYSRFFTHYSGNSQQSENNTKVNDIKVERKQFVSELGSPQDYTSTFKNDFKLPVDSDFKKVVKESKMKEAPLYTLSAYKQNYVDWKIEPCDRIVKPTGQKTLVLGTPTLGESQTKKDYQIPLFLPNTQLAKPPDQVVLPKYSLSQENGLTFKEQLLKSVSVAPKGVYNPVPSFEGQYLSNFKRDYKSNKVNDKRSLDVYEKKIEKFQKKLESEIKELEAN